MLCLYHQPLLIQNGSVNNKPGPLPVICPPPFSFGFSSNSSENKARPYNVILDKSMRVSEIVTRLYMYFQFVHFLSLAYIVPIITFGF